MSDYDYNQQTLTQMDLRLNTARQLQTIRAFLKGKTVISKEEMLENGQIIINQVEEEDGEPLLNSNGVQSLMYYLSSIFDPATVQGNLEKQDDLDKYLWREHHNLAFNLMVNYDKWEIRDYMILVDTVMAQLELFVSRTLGNKERELLNPVMRSHEVQRITPPDEKSGMRIPFFSKGG